MTLSALAARRCFRHPDSACTGYSISSMVATGRPSSRRFLFHGWSVAQTLAISNDVSPGHVVDETARWMIQSLSMIWVRPTSLVSPCAMVFVAKNPRDRATWVALRKKYATRSAEPFLCQAVQAMRWLR